jgi:hypothetical protein
MWVAALLIAMAPSGFPEAEIRPQVRGGEVRSQRPWALSGELGWNGLAGVGLTLRRTLEAGFAIEGGVGFSLEGAKVGLRARYDFSRAEWTPFLGLGFLYCTGSQQDVSDTGSTGPFKYRVGRSQYLQAVVGLEYQGQGGFVFAVATGYARLLSHNLDVTDGTPTSSDLSAARFSTGSGPVLSLSWGRAF